MPDRIQSRKKSKSSADLRTSYELGNGRTASERRADDMEKVRSSNVLDRSCRSELSLPGLLNKKRFSLADTRFSFHSKFQFTYQYVNA
ncbi:unnamed protein product [Gongylonema pulchrum]|uniref:Uncharacterized protein n=1 Tax=Gongylonema pulchrum TaxID=637853 RepID=A0A183DJM4_9BILA|nr:unnamed protein product [Gongylonema pulchrum]VDK66358.1 unnamed protein product [Gongylonema pulchrum]